MYNKNQAKQATSVDAKDIFAKLRHESTGRG